MTPVLAMFVICIGALMSSGWILSDTTHASIFSDATGTIRLFTAGAWMFAALGIVYCLRSRLGTAIAFAGTALAAGAIEGQFFRSLTGSSGSQLLLAALHGTVPWTERLALVALAFSITACVVTTMWMMWRYLRIRGRLHQSWVQLMTIAFGFLIFSELIENTASTIRSGTSASLLRSMLALEEGMGLLLPVIILLACIMLAAALGKSVSAPSKIAA